MDMPDEQEILSTYAAAVNWVENIAANLRGSDGTTTPSEISEGLKHAQNFIDCLNRVENNADFNAAFARMTTTITDLKTHLDAPVKLENPVELPKQKSNAKTSEFSKILAETKTIPENRGLHEIAGYDRVKRQLKTAIVLPLRQPQLFSGVGGLGKSVLLYGPPGTGKTQFAHALAAEANADLYCVTSSTLMSKYIGETEKMIEHLFKFMKNVTKTSILFIDEIDGLCSKRDSSEADYCRRLKTEIMCQLSNFDDNKDAFLVCATNCPWDLDTAFVRRFTKRIYVPLPERQDRSDLLKLFTEDTPLSLTHPFWDPLLDLTAGYSGSDLKDLVGHACLRPVVELDEVKIWKCVTSVENSTSFLPYDVKGLQDFSENLRFCTLDELPEGSARTRDVNFNDLLEATRHVTSTVPTSEITRFENYV